MSSSLPLPLGPIKQNFLERNFIKVTAYSSVTALGIAESNSVPSHLGNRGPGFLGSIVGFFSEPSSMGFAVGLGRKYSMFPIDCNSQGQGQAKRRDLLMLYTCSVLQTPLNIQGCLLV